LSDNIRIVKMEEYHLGQVSDIEESSFSVPWKKEEFRHLMNNDNSRFICAVIDSASNEIEVAGYAGIMYVPAYISEDGEVLCQGSAEILNIAVRSDMRRCGIASLLLGSVEEIAVGLKLDSIMLEVRESNISARALYEKFGFLVNGRRKNYYSKPREDAILMQKDLIIC